MRLGLIAMSLAALSAPAFADVIPPKPQPVAKTVTAAPAQQLSCSGPFVKTATHKSLAAHFGEKNVAWETVDGPEGSTYQVTAIYPKDPARRLEVTWRDEEGRKEPLSIDVKGKLNKWTGPGGVAIAMPAAEIERRNGKPFMMTGYQWDMWGNVVDWKGGKLPAAAKAAGCDNLALRLDETGDSSKAMGEGPYASNSKGIKRAKPVVESFSIGFAYPDPK